MTNMIEYINRALELMNSGTCIFPGFTEESASSPLDPKEISKDPRSGAQLIASGAKIASSLPPPPKLSDPAVDAAREKLRLSEKRRRGRRASILTSQSGTTEDALIRRPKVLGDVGAQTSGTKRTL